MSTDSLPLSGTWMGSVGQASTGSGWPTMTGIVMTGAVVAGGIMRVRRVFIAQ